MDDVLKIGLDVGTGSVKAVSETRSIQFPSIYGYRERSAWEGKTGTIRAVGDDAIRMRNHPGAAVIRPVGEGRPIHTAGFAELVKHAVGALSRDASFSSMVVVVGLPYAASEKSERESLRALVGKVTGASRVVVVPQALGTLRHAGLDAGIVVSVGQGTTEIVAFDNSKPVAGTSLPQSVDFLTQPLGSFSHLDHSVFSRKEVRDRVGTLSDIISNQVALIQGQVARRQTVVLSGGGVMIPGMERSLRRSIDAEITVPDDPVMSNARGLHAL